MRLTSVMMTNTTLINVNRNMRTLDRIIRQIETKKKIQKPSDDPIIASRALMFRTSVRENDQFQRNVDQGVAWMKVTESTFNNINNELFFEMLKLSVQGANGDNYLDNMQGIVRQMSALFNQLGHEMNQSFGGNYLFSGFRTDEPPVFTDANNRSFVITQNFSLADISRETSFQRLVVEGKLSTPTHQIPEPVSHNINVLKLAYRGLDTVPVVPGYEVRTMSINHAQAYLPPVDNGTGVPVLHYIPETGELVMHRDTANAFPREGVSVTYRKTGFREGDINPMVYFTGREILDTSTAHIPTGTQLVYNVTQYFSRATGVETFPGSGMLSFPITYTPYSPAPADLQASLPNTNPPSSITPTSVIIPASYFATNSNVSVTYPVVTNSPVIGGVHIMEDTRVQGVELVRALSDNGDGVAIPLDQIELNRSFDMHNQEIEYEFAPRTRITVNSLSKNVLTDKMFADFRRFFDFADALHLSNRTDLEQHFRSMGIYEEDEIPKLVEDQLIHEGSLARDALFEQFNNMLYLLRRHSENSTREQTLLGARMVRMELIQNRLEADEVSYKKLTSDNEDTDLERAIIMRFSADALFQASLRANSGVVQMSLANFLR